MTYAEIGQILSAGVGVVAVGYVFRLIVRAIRR
jgi:hypothetical protein